MRASDCTSPRNRPCRQVIDSSGRAFAAIRSTTPMMMPTPASMAAVCPEVSQAMIDCVLKSQPEHHDGDRAKDHQPTQPGLASLRGNLPISARAQLLMISQMSLRK